MAYNPWEDRDSSPVWDFTEQPGLPVIYHKHHHNPTICGHWHKGPEVTTTALPKKIIPVVRAYDAVSLDDENWVGFMVWYTGSIKDAPIVVGRDSEDIRLWEISEELLAEGIYNALHDGGYAPGMADVVILDKANDGLRTDGLSGQSGKPELSCANLKTGLPGFVVDEDHNPEEWNDSSYADPSGGWNHEFNGFETFVGAPEAPRIFTGPFLAEWDGYIADSIALQSVFYDWKDGSDPIWEEPEPDNYGPYVNDHEDTGIDNYYYPDYIDAYHLTPEGFDNSLLEVRCAAIHQLWGWGYIVVDGDPVDEVYVGGSFPEETLAIGSASGNEDYMYQGCDFQDMGGGGSEPIAGTGPGSINGHYWWAMVDAWPGGGSPVYYSWTTSGGTDWTREQYHLAGGTLFDVTKRQWGVFEVWEGTIINQTLQYWCDYNVENGLFYVNTPITREDVESLTYSQTIKLYRPKAVFYRADGSISSFDFDSVDDMVPDRFTSDNNPGYDGPVVEGPTGSVNDVSALYWLSTNGDNWECWSGLESHYLCLANPCYWIHNQTGDYSTAHNWTWLIWYNGITDEFESNGQDIPPEQRGSVSYAEFQTYTSKEGTLYYHDAADNDRSADDGTSPIPSYARKRFIITYADSNYSGDFGADPVELPICNPVWPLG